MQRDSGLLGPVQQCGPDPPPPVGGVYATVIAHLVHRVRRAATDEHAITSHHRTVVDGYRPSCEVAPWVRELFQQLLFGEVLPAAIHRPYRGQEPSPVRLE